MTWRVFRLELLNERSHASENEWEPKGARERATTASRKETLRNAGRGVEGKCKKPILTAVNQPIVVLLEGLGAVAAPLEVHCGNSLRASLSVVVHRDVFEGANSGVEELLCESKHTGDCGRGQKHRP